MKKLLLFALAALGACAALPQPTRAGCCGGCGLFGPFGLFTHKWCCGNCYTMKICCRQYNAFTPCCSGAMVSDGCMPWGGCGSPGWGGYSGCGPCGSGQTTVPYLAGPYIPYNPAPTPTPYFEGPPCTTCDACRPKKEHWWHGKSLFGHKSKGCSAPACGVLTCDAPACPGACASALPVIDGPAPARGPGKANSAYSRAFIDGYNYALGTAAPSTPAPGVLGPTTVQPPPSPAPTAQAPQRAPMPTPVQPSQIGIQPSGYYSPVAYWTAGYRGPYQGYYGQGYPTAGYQPMAYPYAGYQATGYPYYPMGWQAGYGQYWAPGGW